jgi:anti-anti-sigma regulatory factor
MIACDWDLHVERGPNWLLAKVGNPLDERWEMVPLADTLRSLMEKHFTYRLVLELDEIELLTSDLIGQLVLLEKWIHARQGVMRLCGLSPHNREILQSCRSGGLLRAYRDRLEAVLGRHRPPQPR